MFTSLDLLKKATTIVYQTPILILASVKCGELEEAGIPAVLIQNRETFTVQVPKAYTKEAIVLLH
jgi:hypothetical protein